MITTTVRFQLECDHGPGLCLRQPTVIATENEFLARNEARRQGWYLNGDTCLCPAHAAERERAELKKFPRFQAHYEIDPSTLGTDG